MILSFWQSIFKTFSDVLEVPTEPSAVTVVFGVAPQDLHLSHRAKNVIAFATFFTRKLKLLEWKEK